MLHVRAYRTNGVACACEVIVPSFARFLLRDVALESVTS